MIHKTLVFLRNNLNEAMLQDPSIAAADLFKFVSMDQDNKLSLEPGKVSIVLVRTEEEKLLRQENPYIRKHSGDPSYMSVAPDIKLYLWVLFIARFAQYEQALEHISDIMSYFQKNRVFDRDNSPNMDVGVPKLVVQLMSLSFEDEYRVWSMLQSPYQPSVLYRVAISVFRDLEGEPLTTTTETQPSIHRKVEG